MEIVWFISSFLSLSISFNILSEFIFTSKSFCFLILHVLSRTYLEPKFDPSLSKLEKTTNTHHHAVVSSRLLPKESTIFLFTSKFKIFFLFPRVDIHIIFRLSFCTLVFCCLYLCLLYFNLVCANQQGMIVKYSCFVRA